MTEKIYVTPNALKALKAAVKDIAPDFAEEASHNDCPLLEIASDSELSYRNVPNDESD